VAKLSPTITNLSEIFLISLTTRSTRMHSFFVSLRSYIVGLSSIPILSNGKSIRCG